MGWGRLTLRLASQRRSGARLPTLATRMRVVCAYKCIELPMASSALPTVQSARRATRTRAARASKCTGRPTAAGASLHARSARHATRTRVACASRCTEQLTAPNALQLRRSATIPDACPTYMCKAMCQLDVTMTSEVQSESHWEEIELRTVCLDIPCCDSVKFLYRASSFLLCIGVQLPSRYYSSCELHLLGALHLLKLGIASCFDLPEGC